MRVKFDFAFDLHHHRLYFLQLVADVRQVLVCLLLKPPQLPSLHAFSQLASFHLLALFPEHL